MLPYGCKKLLSQSTVLTTSQFPPSSPVVHTSAQLVAIFYDLDGTLANTDPFHYQAWQEMLQAFEIEIDEPFYKTRISGRLNPAIVEDLLPHLSPEDSQQFIERKEARFRQLAPQLIPMAGLSDLLAWTATHQLRQALVTNAPPENTYHTLKALHLEQVFDRIIMSEALGIGKPDPAPYVYALQQFELTPDRVLAFEDSPSGIRSAVGAGIPTIGIASTQDPEVLYGVGATLVVSDFSAPELWRLLEKRAGEQP